MTKRIAVLFIVGIFGYGLGQLSDELSYTRGFVDAFRAAPSECRGDLLKNYMDFIINNIMEN